LKNVIQKYEGYTRVNLKVVTKYGNGNFLED